MSINKCEETYRSVLQLNHGGDDQALFRLAQCFIDGFDPLKLSKLLESDDVGLILDGLFIVDEIGPMANNFGVELNVLRLHDDPDVSSTAISILARLNLC